MENAWQYSKLYEVHADGLAFTEAYWDWAHQGWQNPNAVRYPMGRNRKPLGSVWWDGFKFHLLGYISARKTIYGPLYAEAVQKTRTFAKLQELYEKEGELILLDYDAYDHRELNMSLIDVLNEPNKKMGHAFVLAMLLTKDKALKQMELRP